jgi:NAD(P)-dependent dehydrogenase (short-subunit alcohol dehydrogenase family)
MSATDYSNRKVWFVTGAGQGLGRAIVTAALERGDLAAATSRRLDDVAGLSERFGTRVLPLALDVRDRAAAAPALAAVHQCFGRLDVVVNNAARSLRAPIEEVTEADVRDLVDTNLLGTLWVTQAALPYLRAQRAGHIVQISSGGGVISWPTNGAYQATKFGLEGMSEALAQETAHLGIKVTIAQVGHLSGTGFGRHLSAGKELDAYAQPRSQLGAFAARRGNEPASIAATLLKVVDSPEPPLRVLLGRPLNDIRAAYESRLKTWEQWSQLLGS